MTATDSLPLGFTDPVAYATELLYAFYGDFPFGPYAFEGTAEDDAARIAAQPNGVAKLQRQIADDPQADVPDWFRPVLREWAAKGGE